MSALRPSKLVGLEEAVALVQEGCHLAFGGFLLHGKPAAFVRALARAGTSDLTLYSCPTASYDADLLIGLGLVTRTVLAAVGFDHLGAAPRFVAAVESGRIDRVLCDEATVAGGYMATVEGIPYHPIESARGHAVADASPLLTRYRAHTGHDLVAASPLAPDVAVIHVQQADAYGNARHLGSIWGDLLLAKASKTVIITADELVGEDEIRRNPRATTIPGFLVDAVVELPFGAHPCSSPGRYLPDERHLDAYLHGDFDAYVDGFVRLEDDAYLREVGADRLASLEQRFAW